jgi:hypothetical protein
MTVSLKLNETKRRMVYVSLKRTETDTVYIQHCYDRLTDSQALFPVRALQINSNYVVTLSIVTILLAIRMGD